MIKLLINGVNGKMGRVLASMAAEQEQFSVIAGVDRVADSAGRGFPVYSRIETM